MFKSPREKDQWTHSHGWSTCKGMLKRNIKSSYLCILCFWNTERIICSMSGFLWARKGLKTKNGQWQCLEIAGPDVIDFYTMCWGLVNCSCIRKSYTALESKQRFKLTTFRNIFRVQMHQICKNTLKAMGSDRCWRSGAKLIKGTSVFNFCAYSQPFYIT